MYRMEIYANKATMLILIKAHLLHEPDNKSRLKFISKYDSLPKGNRSILRLF